MVSETSSSSRPYHVREMGRQKLWEASRWTLSATTSIQPCHSCHADQCFGFKRLMCIIVFLYPTFSRSYFILVDIHAYFLVEPGKKQN